MLSLEFVQLAVIVLAGLAGGGLIYALVMPYFSDERVVSKRVANVAQGRPSLPCDARAVEHSRDRLQGARRRRRTEGR